MYTVVVAYSLGVRAKRADAVRFIHIEIGLVLLLDLNNLRETQDFSLHRVDTLHNNENLLPVSVSTRLALSDGLPDNSLQVLGI